MSAFAPDQRLSAPVAASADARSPLGRMMANIAHLLGGKAIAGIVSLIYLVIVARSLGVADYGVLVLVNAYAVLIGGVIAFSGFHGVVRYGALARERGDAAELARIVRFMAVVELGCGLMAVLVAAALVPLIGPRLGWSPAVMRMAIPYSVAVMATVRATPQGVLQLAGRFDLIGAHQAVSPMVRLIGVLIAWGLGAGLTGFLIAWLTASVVEGVAMWLLAWPAWRRILDDAPLRGPWRGAARRNAGLGRFILITNFDITLRELAPQLVPLTVGWLLGPAAAGLLALAQRATGVLQQPATLVANGSYPVLAELAARGGGRPLNEAVWRGTAIIAGLSIVILGALALVGGKLLVWIGGGTFAGGTMLMLLVAVGRAGVLASTPLASALTAMGLPGRSASVGLAANVVLYPLLPALLLWLGPNGAGWHAAAQGLVTASLLLAFTGHALQARR